MTTLMWAIFIALGLLVLVAFVFRGVVRRTQPREERTQRRYHGGAAANQDQP